MNSAEYLFEIDTEVPASYFEKLVDFIYRQYITLQKQRFTNAIKEVTENQVKLSYFVLDAQRKQLLKVEIICTQKITVKISPMNPQISPQIVDEARQDVVIATQMFEEKVRKATWYFAWQEGADIVPEKVKVQNKNFNQILIETQILLFFIFIVLGMSLFLAVYNFAPQWFWIAPITLVSVQFLVVFYSRKIIARTSDWTITRENPYIHILEYHLPIGALEEIKETSPEQLAAIKEEVYRTIISKKGTIDCKEAQKVFTKYNVSCMEDNLLAKKINVYELVKNVADKFGYQVPHIVVSNTMVPNAAASGPSPSRGVVLITTGLLVQLEEDEITSVLGHEFGHLKGRDPLILFGLTSAEFLFRFYVLFAFLPVILSSFLFIAYFWAVMTVIFFIAKFFEARADLVSAIVVGKPKVLAEALEKIGFQRLLFERTPTFRLQEWINLDAHPPIYFRIARLKQLQEPVKVKYPLIRSVKEVFSGFATTI
ncbi:MAG: M56 family metallopeptidase [Candidatus Bathyarchaeota archaeon]|nr:M56 family metallopeptidase [Candidatus Bathyarchaeota archaeon]